MSSSESAERPLRILVGHGIHPPSTEPGMRDLYEYATTQPEIDGVKHVIISEEEWESKTRFVNGENLAVLLPDANGSRGQRILQNHRLEAQSYDLVIYPHGSPIEGAECIAYGATATLQTKLAARHFGTTQAIIQRPGIMSILPQSFAIEIPAVSPILKPEQFYQKLASLALHGPQTSSIPDEYIYIGGVTGKTAQTLSLKPFYQFFELLTPRDTELLRQKLGTTKTLYAFEWSSDFDESTGFRGSVVTAYSPELPLKNVGHIEHLVI